MSSAESSVLSPAEEAFAEFLELRETDDVDFDSFCRERPRLELALRRLHTRWQVFDDAISADLQADGVERFAAGDSAERLLQDLRRQSSDDSRYVERAEIGRGGMGRVLKVWDNELRRSLAMKVLADRRNRDARSLARFLDEAMVTGQLEHPGIVPVHELGLDADGRVYFTMPFVRGENLLAIFRRMAEGKRGWTRQRIIEVLLRVCDAVGYAHARGVVHRDLKPANIMVGPFGETYVMDWGLARILGMKVGPETPSAAGLGSDAFSQEVRSVRDDVSGGDESSSPLNTMEGDIVGTPVYMAPEQAHGWIEQVGPATDVYSIGAMLYQLLSGHRPYLSPGEEDSAEAVLRAVKMRPPRPIHTLAKDVPPELEAICDKAMAREIGDRYATTVELATDLRAFLDHRVVRAYEGGAVAELKKWVDRNRRLAAALAGGFASVVIGLAISTALFFQARHNEGVAKAEQGRADANATRLAQELRVSQLAQGRLSGANGQFQRAEDILWRAHLTNPTTESRWLLWELYARYPQRDIAPMPNVPHDMVASPDGSLLLVTAGEVEFTATDLLVIDSESLEILATLPAGEGAALVALDASGRYAWTAGRDAIVREWDLVTRNAPRVVAAMDGPIVGIQRDARRDRWLLAAQSGSIHAAGDDGSLTAVFEAPDKIAMIGLADDGHTLAVGLHDTRVLLLDAESMEATHELSGHGRWSWNAEFTDDGRVLIAGQNNTVSIWDVATGELLERLSPKNGDVYGIEAIPGGAIALGGWYRTDLIDAGSYEVLRSFHTPSWVRRIISHGTERITALRDRGLANWDLASARQRLVVLGKRTAFDSHASGRFLIGDGAGNVRVINPTVGEVASWKEPARVAGLDAAGDLVASRIGGEVIIRRIETAEEVCRVPSRGGQTQLRSALFLDGSRIAVSSLDESPFAIHAVPSGQRLAGIGRAREEPISIASSPTGDRIATVTRTRSAEGSWQHWLSTWSPDGKELGRVHSRYAWTLSFAPDGSRIAIGQYGLEALVYDAVTLQPSAALTGHTGNAWSSAWHPTEPDLLATCSDDGTIRLWNADSGANILAIDTGASHLGRVEFSPDGTTIAASSKEGVLIWDLTYFDRHIAGNVAYQVERLGDELGDAAGAAEVEAWAREVLARPWPRLAR